MKPACLAMALTLAACAHASRSGNPPSWSEVQTDHFLLRTDLAPDEARAAAGDLELVRAALLGSGWYDGTPAPGRQAVVEFAAASELREFFDKGIVGFVGPSVFGHHVMVVSADEPVSDQGVVKHELTHVLNDRLFVSKPRWVNEGLACYLETMRLDRRHRRLVIGEADRNRLDFLREHPVNRYFSDVINIGDHAYDMPAYAGYAFETGAWLLVHWMIDTRPAQFRAYVKQLARGENAWVAFTRAFGDLGEQRIDTEIRAWLREGVRTATLPLPADGNGDVAVRSVAPAEVFALRADLLRISPWLPRTGEDRKQVVAAEVHRALAIDPAQPLALALVDGSDAAPAVAAHPDDWRAWVLLYDRKHGDRNAIERAAALEPENATVLLRLAYSDQHIGKSREAMAHALHAVELAPGRADALDALAQIYAAQGRCGEAVDTEQRALDAAPDSANSGAPAWLRKRMHDIANNCRQKER